MCGGGSGSADSCTVHPRTPADAFRCFVPPPPHPTPGRMTGRRLDKVLLDPFLLYSLTPANGSNCKVPTILVLMREHMAHLVFLYIY